MKKCSKCGKEKSASEFYPSANMKSGLSSQCKVCNLAGAKSRYDWDRTRALRLKQKYGISVEDYDNLLKEQDGKCAICGSKDTGRVDCKNFAVDHDHATNDVRGLLCKPCNTGLGMFKDSPEMLEAAAAYLRKHQR
jgi:5-methylcytosine-specific restriction endonuclease McrA